LLQEACIRKHLRIGVRPVDLLLGFREKIARFPDKRARSGRQSEKVVERALPIFALLIPTDTDQVPIGEVYGT
jgi:hypothetical protein